MSVSLREIRDDEVAEYERALHTFYVEDLVSHGGLTRVEAEEKSSRDHAELFPDGKRAEGVYLYAIEDEEGRAIGRLMYGDRPFGTFLYAIELDPAARGQGHGRAAMEAFEALVRERGESDLRLNVFGGNDVARSLYRSLGYVDESVHMRKRLA